jgi:gluconolactonase
VVAHGFPDLQRYSEQQAAAVHAGRAGQRFSGEFERSHGNRFDAQGRLYTCESHSRRVTRTDKKGKVEVLAERWQGKRLNAPNDLAVRKEGDVYFTDPAFGNQQDTRELDFFGVYHISRKGELEVIAKPKGRPNGIALAPDGRTLYVSNSDEKNVRVYDLDKSGAASNERILISGIEGVPDGICVDEKGDLYVAANQIQVYSPEGKPLGPIRTEETPSNCAFGDPGSGIAVHHGADLGLSRALGRERDLVLTKVP